MKKIGNVVKTVILSIIISLSSTNICYADVDLNKLQSYLNGVVSQEQINQSNNPKYADRAETSETVDPLTGNLILKQNDLNLTGKDGLDLSLSRLYNSSEDECDKKMSVKEYQIDFKDNYAYQVKVIQYNEKGEIIYSINLGPYTYSDAYSVYTRYRNLKNYVANIQDMYWRQPIYRYEYGNYTDENTYNKKLYSLGAGWSFAFPSVQVETDGRNTYLYYHDGNGSTYKVINVNNVNGTSNLEGYQSNDVLFLSDNGSYTNDDGLISAYKFIDANLTTTYFDKNGLILSKIDRFNNKIKFRYVAYSDSSTGNYWHIDQIQDSVGRIVKFTYTKDDISVKVTAPNETKQLSITYNRLIMTRNICKNGSITKTYEYPILNSVTDTLGRKIYYENYYYYNNNTWPSEKFEYVKRDLSSGETMDRYLLGAIVYPGSKTLYQYEKATRNLGLTGLTEVYRIKSRSDQIQRYSSNNNAWEWVGNSNKVDYSYGGDYSGYPTYYDDYSLPDSYQFWSQSTTSNGLQIRNVFNKNKQLIQTETTANNNEKQIVKNIEFDRNFIFNPTKTETTKYASNGTLAQTLYTGTTYTDWGAVSSTTLPLTLQQYNDASSKAKYTTSYSYDNTKYKDFVTKKQYYQNDTKLLTETYNYNDLGRISSMVNAKGETVSYSYYSDANNNQVIEATENLENNKTAKTKTIYGSETSYAYPKTIVKCYTNSSGVYTESRTNNTYDMLLGLVKTETDDENKTTTYTYDNDGRVTSIRMPDFSNKSGENYVVKQEYTYTDGYNWDYVEGNYSGIYGTTINAYLTYTHKLSGATSYYNQYFTLYDAYGNERQESLCNGPGLSTKAKYTYDNLQRVISKTDAEGNLSSQAYDGWGQVKEATDPSGNLYINEYDIISNKNVSYFVAKDNIANYRANPSADTYKEDYVEINMDQFGRTTSRKVYQNWPSQNGDLSELYSYDVAGNLIGYTDPNRNLNQDGVTTTYSYDELNRITNVKNALNQIIDVSYNVLGNITSIKQRESADSTNSITLYTKSYDELGELLSKADSSSMTTNYSYNSIGLNTKMVDRNGSSTSISYDALNRITDTSQTGADNQSSLGYKYNYNNPFGPNSEQLYINGSLATQNQYTYGADGQITKKDTSGAGLINSNLKLQYDNAGRLKSVGTGVADSNYFYTNYKYTNDRITKVQTNGAETEDSGDNANAAYDYYPDGKLKKITYPKLNDNSYLTSEYVYNALGRLTSLTNRKGNTVISQYSYTYDSNGNITSVNDGQNIKTYTYDKLNRLKTIQPQTGSKIVYNYDLRGNRITETKTPKFILNNASYTYDLENILKSVAKGQSVTRMSYYADGLRAKKDSSLGSTSYQYNTSGQLIAEAKNSSTVTTNYIWGPDRVLEKKDVGGGEYYYLYNGHGDVVQMVDKNGNVVNNYQYDEWGNITTGKETVSNPFKYAGEVYDDETGLYYLRARYYDPQLGRFLNEDIVEGQVDNPLSLNLYSYCYGNPLIYVDPSGNVVDTIVDAGFLLWDIYDIANNPTNVANWAALGADAGCALVPGVTGGGRAIKIASKVTKTGKKLTKLEKVSIAISKGEKLSASLKDALRANARSIMKKNSKFMQAVEKGQKLQVHHLIPLEYAHLFGKDYNPNNIYNLYGVDNETHQILNRDWREFKDRLKRQGIEPSKQDVIDFASITLKKYGKNFIK